MYKYVNNKFLLLGKKCSTEGCGPTYPLVDFIRDVANLKVQFKRFSLFVILIYNLNQNKKDLWSILI